MEKNTWGQYFANCYRTCQKRQSVWIHNGPPQLDEERSFPEGPLSNGGFEPDMDTSSSSSSSTDGFSDSTSSKDGDEGKEFFEMVGPDEEEQPNVEAEEVVSEEKKGKGGWGGFWGSK